MAEDQAQNPNGSFCLIQTNPMGEVLMATPAISEGLLLVRTPSKLIALVKSKAPAD